MIAPRPWVCRLILVAAVVLVFGRLLGCDFVLWDDEHTVYNNPRLNPDVNAAGLVDFWTKPAASIYVPLTYSVWAALTPLARRPADAAGVTLNPAVYHAANVIVHAAGVLVLFELLRRAARPQHGASREQAPRSSDIAHASAEASAPDAPAQSPRLWRGSSDAQPTPQAWALHAVTTTQLSNHATGADARDGFTCPALLGALLWALHPLQVESVGWVSGLKDVLSGALALAALAAFVVFRQGRRRWWFVLAVVAYALALLAKPSAMTLPLLLVLIDRFALGTPGRRVMIGAAAFVLVTVPVALIARAAQPAPASGAPPGVRALLVGDTLAFYAAKTVAPLSLAFDYGRDVPTLRAGRELYVAWLVPVGVAAATAWAYRRARRRGRPLSPLPAVGLTVFALAPLPVLGVTRFDFQVISTVADHYAYVALAGVAMIVAWAVTRWPKAWPAVAAVVVVFGVRSAWQCRVWQDSETLFSHALVVNPRSWSSQLNLATLATLRHDADAVARHLAAAEAVAPDEPSVHLSLLADAARRGDKGKAYDAARRLIRAYDASWTPAGFRAGEPYALIVKTFLDTGRDDAAAEFVEQGLERDPTEPRLQAAARRLGITR